MNPQPYEETQLLPLITDAEIESRIAELVGRANTRQLWLMFLDDVDVQLPLLIPIEGLPPDPVDDQIERVVDSVRELMGDVGAASIVVVHERYASPELSSRDRAWALSLREAFDRVGVHLRSQLLSHRSGVRLIADEELRAD